MPDDSFHYLCGLVYIMTFNDLGLRTDILQAVEALGFTHPTEIQQKAIPILLPGQQDFVGLAQTGTGKTAAFGLPMMQQTNFSENRVQTLVMSPTRELCMQITNDLKSYASFQSNPRIVAVYGGASISEQIKKIRKGVQIIVATPGRLLDLINRKVINLGTIKTVVLDEADEMLNMGFKEDIDAILDRTPGDKRVWLFSATMPLEVRRIAENYMHDPLEVLVGNKNSSAENIEHHYFMMKERDRYYTLKRILDYYPEIYGLIFCRTRKETGSISEKLEKEGYQAVALHGDLSQMQRDAAMKKFREKTVRILVATDVAARGLDVEDITHVIHYNLPDDIEGYTHRSGRTARAGKSGMSISLINTREAGRIRQIEKSIKVKIGYAKIPDAEDICERQMYSLLDKVVRTSVNEKAIERYWPVITSKLNHLEAEEIVMKFISAELNTFLEYYKGSGNLNAQQEKGRSNSVTDRKHSKTGGKNNRNLSGATSRFFINMGERQNMNKGALVRLVCTETGIKSGQIGRIDIYPGFSFFEVDDQVASVIMPSLEKGTYEGKGFIVEPSQPGSNRKKGKKRKKKSRN